jgi:hypothetical protein
MQDVLDVRQCFGYFVWVADTLHLCLLGHFSVSRSSTRLTSVYIKDFMIFSYLH